MAEVPTLNAAAGATEAAPPAAAKKPLKLILIVVGVLLLAGGGVGAWLFLGHGKAEKTQAAPVAQGPALYIALDPPFVTNFEAEQLVRFLQVTVQLMSHDQPTVDLIKANDPAIRNDLLMLLSNQKYAEISTRDGKEQLRTQALAAVRRVIASNGGHPERIEALYFTSFVMQ
ncbi:MAG TPA: flagellar basal body-associated FliL family protein [Steroidobacteraceae bacterium]|nr:flagellar basal body-associated FliL family protein [Steroidobacteraceae bacterium]